MIDLLKKAKDEIEEKDQTIKELKSMLDMITCEREPPPKV